MEEGRVRQRRGGEERKAKKRRGEMGGKHRSGEKVRRRAERRGEENTGEKRRREWRGEGSRWSFCSFSRLHTLSLASAPFIIVSFPSQNLTALI